ncbi:MAG: hypothetical protein FWG74_08200, partial [Planctomycetes bacterium]|nr:hypothetical protein [Planctomycetota bacterium]
MLVFEKVNGYNGNMANGCLPKTDGQGRPAMFENALESASYLRAGHLIPRQKLFFIPSSSLRSDGMAVDGRDTRLVLLRDSFEPSPLYFNTVAYHPAAQISSRESGLAVTTDRNSEAGSGNFLNRKEVDNGASPGAAESSSEEDRELEKSSDGATNAQGEPLNEQERAELAKLQ